VKTKLSPTIVGVFVIGAIALGVLALLSFGGLHFFSQPQRFVVYFDESVHGLDLGSAVKLSGVRIGHVVDLNVRYDARSNHSQVGVVCELSRDILTDAMASRSMCPTGRRCKSSSIAACGPNSVWWASRPACSMSS
jgi:paraquat-inducible protein B